MHRSARRRALAQTFSASTACASMNHSGRTRFRGGWVVLLWMLAGSAMADDWPAFRGPDGNSVAHGSGWRINLSGLARVWWSMDEFTSSTPGLAPRNAWNARPGKFSGPSGSTEEKAGVRLCWLPDGCMSQAAEALPPSSALIRRSSKFWRSMIWENRATRPPRSPTARSFSARTGTFTASRRTDQIRK